MFETTSEFLQKSYKRYANGRSAQQAKKTLANAFKASSEKDAAREKMLFEGILDSVMKTPEGRRTLMTLSQFGYSFAFEKGNFGGFCDSTNKKIVINPSFSLEYMLQTAVHEGRHAIQFSLENPNAPSYEKMQVASLLRQRRAIEADAVAHEMAFVYQCKNVLPKVYESAKEQGLPMFHAYVNEMDKSHDERKAMQACFKAWYECDYYRNYYDKWHKDGVGHVCEYAKKAKNPDCFSKEYPVEDVLRMCCYKGKPYMSADFLNSGKPFSITPEDKKEIVFMLQDYADSVAGAKMDKSVLHMAERNKNGELIKPASLQEKPISFISTRLSQKGR